MYYPLFFSFLIIIMSSFVSSLVKTYNNLFSFNNTNITIIFDSHNKIWFSLSDIFKSLGYSSPNAEIKRLNIESEYVKTYNEIFESIPLKYRHFDKPKNLQPHMKMTNETGIYMILTKSKKEIAKKFRDSLYQDIIPKLRENGEYKFNLNDKKKLNTLTKKIKNLKLELNRTKKQSINTNDTGKGYIYILEINTPHNGKDTKCFKIGYTSNLERRMSTYKTGNPAVKLAHHENINCNKKQLEKCIINLNHLKLLKRKSEIICNTTLKELKSEIEDCKKLLYKHSISK
jgi:prophage antirepressor-like protein